MKKNDNKGFTLLELLAVIVVLAVLMLIIYPSIENTLFKSRTQGYETQIASIEDGARNWAADNVRMLPDEDQSITVTVSELEAGGYIPEDLLDTRYSEVISKDSGVKITNVGNQYDYEFQE